MSIHTRNKAAQQVGRYVLTARGGSRTSTMVMVVVGPFRFVPERQAGPNAGGQHFELLFTPGNRGCGRIELGIHAAWFEEPVAIANRVQDIIEHPPPPTMKCSRVVSACA